MLRVFGHAGLTFFLTLLTQIGGLAWIIAILIARGFWARVGTGLVAYLALTMLALLIAPSFGRVPLGCTPPRGAVKILIEPHIPARLGVSSRAIRFQGCRAARHDDHIHNQIS